MDAVQSPPYDGGIFDRGGETKRRDKLRGNDGHGGMQA
jgi:hypothetical protein